MALFSAVTACAILFMAYTIINSKVDSQLERNQRLNNAITKLDKEIADIKNLKEQISVMLERKQVVENLQINRSQAVIIFDELSRQLPEGMYFKSIKQEGNVITIEGVADTNARVATLVRNFNQSNWVQSPILIEIKAMTSDAQKQNQFILTVTLKAPATQEEASASPVAGTASQS
jgi:type IV pilus assembly protein PilN